MKPFIVCFIACCMFCNADGYSQNISGRMSVSGIDKSAAIKEKTPVQLFKSFKDNRYKVNFSFSAKDLPKEGIVLFDMKTTVKLNGKTIGASSRDGWPWIPGDMFMPAEAFDFIPILQKQNGKLTRSGGSGFAAGNYEIVLEMKPSAGQKITGTINPATISFKVQ